MITDDEVEKAISWLRDNAKKAGVVAAQREHCDEWLKVEKARLMGLFVGLSNAAAEAEALRHPAYMDALSAKKAAVEADVEMRWLKSAAEAKISAWQTYNANQRAEARAYK